MQPLPTLNLHANGMEVVDLPVYAEVHVKRCNLLVTVGHTTLRVGHLGGIGVLFQRVVVVIEVVVLEVNTSKEIDCLVTVV